MLLVMAPVPQSSGIHWIDEGDISVVLLGNETSPPEVVLIYDRPGFLNHGEVVMVPTVTVIRFLSVMNLTDGDGVSDAVGDGRPLRGNWSFSPCRYGDVMNLTAEVDERRARVRILDPDDGWVNVTIDASILNLSVEVQKGKALLCEIATYDAEEFHGFNRSFLQDNGLTGFALNTSEGVVNVTGEGYLNVSSWGIDLPSGRLDGAFRVLNSSEVSSVFEDRNYTGVSMRAITTEIGVNIVARHRIIRRELGMAYYLPIIFTSTILMATMAYIYMKERGGDGE